MTQQHWLGVDTGGTFTDFVYFDGDQVRIHKVLSTPDAPERAILQGIKQMQIAQTEALQLIHGSTVATNAVLEGKGVKTVYITNRGFADVLHIGRQARAELYNLTPEPQAPLLPSSQCLEINARISAQGEELQALLADDVDELNRALQQIQPQAVAINLLFSFLDDRHERELMQQLKAHNPALFICHSADVLPEYKEYERGMATCLNAYVGPLMQGYLKRLSSALNVDAQQANKSCSLSVMQSAGGTIDAEYAGQHAVNLLLSGPAGGLKGAQYVAGLSGENRLLSFDMGGTSTDVALMDQAIKLTSEGSIGPYPVAVPMVDMHTIGAGGGSIARVDGGGLLVVGPESAGAAPGPACYGQGGQQATVTDANLILGRLRNEGFANKNMPLDESASRQAMQPIADALGVSIELAAEGVVKLANAHMVRALRMMSVEKGYTPTDFALTCFGGAGGLHVCALAEALQMQRAIVPIYGGVLSALGMLVSAPARELSHTLISVLESCDPQEIQQLFNAMQQQGEAAMQRELRDQPAQLQASVDLRYRGQSFSLNIDWCNDLQQLQQRFHALHETTYGHRLDLPVELVNLRLGLHGAASPFKLPELARTTASEPIKSVNCYGFEKPVPVYQRSQLGQGAVVQGPALILESVSTTWLENGWQCEVDRWGNLLLSHH